jgi:RimJ/RimL family protein N-acetyltransferase
MTDITIRPWSTGDLPLLIRANDVAMTTHLAGPESDEEVCARQSRYLRLWEEGGARMFVIVADGQSVGGIGWWDTQWRGDDVHETGWFVLPEAQGRGIARRALALIIEDARTHGNAKLLAAFPAVDNEPSNALCRTSGFTHVAVESFPFRGQTLLVNAWVLELERDSSTLAEPRP